MAAIGLGRADVMPYLSQGVRVACENSASSVTISGDVDRLNEAMASIQRDFPNALVRRLQVEMAYHSRKPFSSFQSFNANMEKTTCGLLETITEISFSSI